VIQYEHLLQNVIEELEPCVEFLGFKLSPERAQCIKQLKEGNFHRPPRPKAEMDFLLKEVLNNTLLNEFQQIQTNVTETVLNLSVKSH
jgi:hypothetical protein